MNDPFTIAAERASAFILEEIKGQIETSAFKTGTLMNSVRTPYVREGDSFTFLLEDPTGYGDFTDFGTRVYRATDRGPFTPEPQPSPGEGGIVPRFWSSLNDTQWARVEMFFEEALEETVNEEIDL